MHKIYNLVIALANWLLPVIGWFSSKMKRSVEGRKEVMNKLGKELKPMDSVVWFHCASLGEYEQGLPVMEAIKLEYPELKLLITFFSPSGYEIKKNSMVADCVTYLPLDTPQKARQFVETVRPVLAVFVKYEFWPNYLQVLEALDIPTLYISATFRPDQIFFKWYGKFMQPMLGAVTHFFVQNAESRELLLHMGYTNVTLSGDTRFDRVVAQLSRDNDLAFAKAFTENRTTIVCGSTWPEDEAVLVPFLNRIPKNVCVIIAPHEIKGAGIQQLQKQLEPKSILLSQIKDQNLQEYGVLIVDSIGYLSRLYQYGDLAYVGGAMGTGGLHNILEPATFGLPIVIGKNFDKFEEAKTLKKQGGLYSVHTAEQATIILSKLVTDIAFRERTGAISKEFIRSNVGATETVVNYVRGVLG